MHQYTECKVRQIEQKDTSQTCMPVKSHFTDLHASKHDISQSTTTFTGWHMSRLQDSLQLHANKMTFHKLTCEQNHIVQTRMPGKYFTDSLTFDRPVCQQNDTLQCPNQSSETLLITYTSLVLKHVP